MRFLKWPFYVIETAFFWLIFMTSYLLPYKVGSSLGGHLTRFVGPLLPINHIARINLKRAFPEQTSTESHMIIKGMWENLGRTIFEYVKLPDIDPFGVDSPYEIKGIQHLDQLIKDGKPGLLFTAHIGHWEAGPYVAIKRGLGLAQVSRFLNNPFLRAGVNFAQGRMAQELIAKGKEGIWDLVSVLRHGGHVSMMMDQKMNSGVAVPFFGHDAMTAPAIAKFALRFECPILPVQVERLDGVRCRVTFHPPLQVPQKGTVDEKVFQLLLQINQHLENWIRQRPEQWFWLHKRWDKELYKIKRS